MVPWTVTPPNNSNSAQSGAEYCDCATSCGTSSKNVREEVDKLYVSLAGNLLGEA